MSPLLVSPRPTLVTERMMCSGESTFSTGASGPNLARVPPTRDRRQGPIGSRTRHNPGGGSTERAPGDAPWVRDPPATMAFSSACG